MARTLVGSLYYASPEQVWGETLDNRSDIYALGVVLYEMVTGQRPFTGRSMPELTQAIIAGTPKMPRQINPEIPPELEQIIWKALAKDRNQRYEDAGLMAQSLHALSLSSPADHNLVSSGMAEKSYIDASQPSSAPLVPRGYVIAQPPKRPLAQHPAYLDTNIQMRPQLSEAIPPITPLTPEVQPDHSEESTRPLAAITGVPVQPSQPMPLAQSVNPAMKTRAVEIWTPPDRHSLWDVIAEWLRGLKRHD